MQLENCPTCHNNDWERLEGKKFFSCRPCREKKIFVVEEKHEEKKINKRDEQKNIFCPLCGANDWWSPIGSPLKKICWACQLPTSQSLVGVRFFFDDSGKKWLITNNSNGSEIWEREDFA